MMQLELSKILCALALLAYGSNASSDRNVTKSNSIASNPISWTEIGSNASLLCKLVEPQEIKLCFWKNAEAGQSKDKHKVLEINSTNTYPGYSFYGQGFGKGECGISIAKVEASDLGNWTCNLITMHLDTREILIHNFGDASLLRWEAPPQGLRPNISDKHTLTNMLDLPAPMKPDIKRNVTCCVRALGKPNPSIHFELGGKSLIEKKVKLKHYQHNDSNCLLWTDAVFLRGYNGKELRCVMDHISFPPNKTDDYDVAHLNVQYPPELENLNEHTRIDIDNQEGDFVITVIVHGNPSPKLELTVRSGDHYTNISHPTFKNKFRTMVDTLNDSKIRVIITILNIKKMTDKEEIIVAAKNKHGNKAVTFTFGGEMNNDIIYIGIFSAVVVLLVGLIIGVTIWKIRKTRKEKTYQIIAKVTKQGMMEDVVALPVNIAARRANSGRNETSGLISSKSEISNKPQKSNMLQTRI